MKYRKDAPCVLSLWLAAGSIICSFTVFCKFMKFIFIVKETVNGKKEKKRAVKKKNIILIVILAVVVVIGAVIIGGSAYVSSLNKPYDLENENLIVISVPSGSSTSEIGSILQENGIIKSADGFKLYGRIKKYDGKLKAGEYSLSPAMNLEEISAYLSKDTPIPTALPCLKD